MAAAYNTSLLLIVCHPLPSALQPMMMVWKIRGKIIRTVLCCTIVKHSCTQSYAQLYNNNDNNNIIMIIFSTLVFTRVKRNNNNTWTMFIVLWSCHNSLWEFTRFFLNYTYFTLPCRGLGLVGLALYLVHWPTIVLQCLTLLVGSSDP